MERPLVDTAIRYFCKASSEYPASVTAQAAFIAAECKREDLDPFSLLRQLKQNPGSFNLIQQAAMKAHRSHGVTSSLPSLDTVQRIVDSDFQRAQFYMILEPDELGTIYGPYYLEIKGQADIIKRERIIRDRARALVKIKEDLLRAD